MTHVFRSLFILVPSLVSSLTIYGQDQVSLSRSLKRDIDQTFIPAIHKNDLPVVVQTTRNLIHRAGDTRTAQLDAYLKSKGLPDCGSLLLEARMTIDARKSTGGSRPDGRTSITEFRPLFETLHARLTALKAASSNKLTVEKFQQTKVTFSDYASFLRDVYRMGSTQQKIIRHFDFATQFIQTERRLINGISDPALKQLCSAQQFDDDRTQAGKLFEQLVKTEIKLRWQRLRAACDVLASADVKLSERFVAAFPARLDATYLPQTLHDAGAADESEQSRILQRLIAQAKQDAGDLWDRSYRFHVGLDWWRRGRFGRGQHGGGLMKGFDALKSLDQQIALNMPEEFPKVTKPTQSSIRLEQYPLSRRHKHHWQVEPPKGTIVKTRKWFG
ncbi:MAG: hypothetical protein ABGZ53_34695 [Fuerstiella sp.]